MPSSNQFSVWWPPGFTIYGVLGAIGGLTNGTVWNGAALVAPTLGNWASYAIPFVQGTVPQNADYCDGRVPYTASFPSGNMTASYYTMQPRIQTGASPLYQNDQPIPYGSLNQLTLNWNGSDVIALTSGTSIMLANALLCQPQNLYDEYGKNNIVQWSDLDGTGIENTAREWLMCIRASTFTNGFFNGGNRQVLESLNDQETVTRWVSIIAGCYLYASRNAEVDSPGMFGMRGAARIISSEFGRFQQKYNGVMDEMGEYKIGYQIAAGGRRSFPYYGSGDPAPYPAGDLVSGWLKLP